MALFLWRSEDKILNVNDFFHRGPKNRIRCFFVWRRTPTIRYDNPSLNRHFGKPTSLIVGFGIFAVICDDLISGRQKRGHSGNTCTAIKSCVSWWVSNMFGLAWTSKFLQIFLLCLSQNCGGYWSWNNFLIFHFFSTSQNSLRVARVAKQGQYFHRGWTDWGEEGVMWDFPTPRWKAVWKRVSAHPKSCWNMKSFNHNMKTIRGSERVVNPFRVDFGW